MDIWLTRKKSQEWLSTEMKKENFVIDEGMVFLRRTVEIFDALSKDNCGSQVGEYSRICGLTLAKFTHLLLGCYSLALDGLAQESGALLRPLIEAYELLVYFRQDKSRIQRVIDNSLPSAGNIAIAISGKNKKLRDYLNANSSHFSYKEDSTHHLFTQNRNLSAFPRHSKQVLWKNICIINAFQLFCLQEAICCLEEAQYEVSNLVIELEKWEKRSLRVFSITNQAV